MADPALAVVDLACAAGDCERSIELVEEILRRRPSDFRLHYRLGVCHGGGCRPHPLVHAEMAVSYLREALRLTPGPDLVRAGVLDQLGGTWLHTNDTPRAQALQAAIDCNLESAEIYRNMGMQDDWARAHFNIGNSFCDLSEATGGDHWQQAIDHYEFALQVRTREKDPDRYAAVLENLGTAWRRMPAPEPVRNIKISIQCYRRALAVYTRASHPDKNASLQNNLGNAFLSLAELDEASASRNARRALRHFDQALRIQSSDPRSRAFGITQYNRAQAYFHLARQSPAGNLSLAIACLQAAATAFRASGEDRYTDLIRLQLERACPKLN